MNSRNIPKAITFGIFATILLLGVYFGVLTLISGWGFTVRQFSLFWYFIVSLAFGFGIQVGLYTYLKGLVKSVYGEGKMLGVTGATSVVSMISCCTHYLANLLPILGAVGIMTLVAQYQVQFFWMGLLLNLLGVLYVGHRLIKFKKQI